MFKLLLKSIFSGNLDSPETESVFILYAGYAIVPLSLLAQLETIHLIIGVIGLLCLILLVVLMWKYTLTCKMKAGTRLHQDSGKPYRTLIDSYPNPIMVIQKDKYVFANQAAIKVLGYSKLEEIINLPFRATIGSESLSLFKEQQLEQIGSEQTNTTLEIKIIRPDGTDLYLESTFAPITYQGKPAVMCVSQDISQRKTIAAALAHSETKLSGILNAMVDIVFVIDNQGRIIFYHAPEKEKLYLAPENFIGKKYTAILPRHVVVLITKAIEKNKVGTISDLEYWIDIHDHPMCFSAKLSPIIKQDIYQGSVAVIRDITEYKRISEKIEKSEERYRTLFENANDAIFILKDQHFIKCNRKTLTIYGCEHYDEILGFTPWDFSPAYQPDGTLSSLKAQNYINAALKGQPQRFYWTHQRKNGEEFHTEVTLNQLLIKTGNNLMAIVRDISKQRSMEQALRASEERFRSLFENVAIGLYRTTPDGKILLANPTLIDMIGYSSFEELSHLNLEKAGFTPQYSRHEFKQKIEKKGQVVGLESAWNREDGKILFVRESARAIKDEQGKTIYYEGTVEDITQRKEAENKLEAYRLQLETLVSQRTQTLQAVNEELKAFVYTVSHDLRAPLRALEGFSVALQEDCATQLDQAGQNYINRIIKVSQEMDTLIKDLLEYSRLTRREISITTVNLSNLISEVVNQFEQMIASKKARLVVAPPLHSVMGHPLILKQVIQNLLSNALKFVSQEKVPYIKITTQAIDSRVRLLIKDNGIGIAKKHQQKIFNVFERLHGIENYTGTGIGLAVVKKAMQRLNGRYGVISKLNQGSTFWIELPKSNPEIADYQN